MFFKCLDIESMMNRAGKNRIPFLFGLDFEMENGFFIERPMLQSEILFEVNGIGNFNNHQINLQSKSTHIKQEESNNYQFYIFPEEYSKYKERFYIVMEGLKKGDTYLTNLTARTAIKTSLTLKDILLRSNTPYKLYIPNKLVCFSPECFVKIKDGKIFTYPMKGTISEEIEDAEKIILNDEKEKAEHNTIVDLLRNDLSKVADNVDVTKFRYIDRIRSNRGGLLQVSSEIEGTLCENYLDEIGSLIFKLVPAGSISGAPKRTTLDLISSAEKQKRGYYTGVGGYFDGMSLNSFVLIRFIEQDNGELYFRSGGGITAMSNPEKEYGEMLQKVYLPF